MMSQVYVSSATVSLLLACISVINMYALRDWLTDISGNCVHTFAACALCIYR